MIALLLLAASLASAQEPPSIDVPSVNPLIAEGDTHYRKRQEGRAGNRANPREIGLAVASYDTAARAPDSIEARWKLARALYFQGAYTGLDSAARAAKYEKARQISEEAFRFLEKRVVRKGGSSFEGRSPDEIAAALSSDPDAAPTLFWASVAWGEWALESGKIQAARTGAAEKVRDYATILIAMDPNFEEGGGYRVLGRLHDQAPNIPFLTGWVSREKALFNLRKAVEVDGKNLINRHFLAEALASGNATERAEAIRLEEAVMAGSPSPGHLVEEIAIQIEAAKNLQKWKKA